MVFHWSLIDSMSSQVLETLLGILADLNNAVVNMISTFKSSSPFTNPLVTYRALHLQLVSPSLSCSIVFSVF